MEFISSNNIIVTEIPIEIPGEVIIIILSKLSDITDLLMCRLINKFWNKLATHDDIWTPLVNIKFPPVKIKFSAFQTFCQFSTPLYVMLDEDFYLGLTNQHDIGKNIVKYNRTLNIDTIIELLNYGVNDKDGNRITIEDLSIDDRISPSFTNDDSKISLITERYCQYINMDVLKKLNEIETTYVYSGNVDINRLFIQRSFIPNK